MLAFCAFIPGSFAQDSFSTEQLAFRNSMEEYLKKENYNPFVDEEDNSLMFRAKGDWFWLYVNKTGPFYIELHMMGVSIEDMDVIRLLEACNYANSTIRCSKAYVNAKELFITTEVYVDGPDEFKAIFRHCISTANDANKRVLEYYYQQDE